MRLFRGLFLTVVVSLVLAALHPGHMLTGGFWRFLPRVNATSLFQNRGVSLPLPTSGYDLHFSPAENLEHIDIALIRESPSHLDMAMYALTDQAVAQAIVEVANRGVHVRIYRDLEQYQQEQARNAYITALFRGNRNIEVRVKRSRTLMHLKQYSNGHILRLGEANMSPSGLKAQDNSLIITSNAEDIRLFQSNFNELWGRRDNIVIQ
jgi:phosphatidylserine/phosphatidylglycerophosphate/cardiolipin synthase-like enzyme